MRRIEALHAGFTHRTVLRVTPLEMAASGWRPDIQLLVRITRPDELMTLHRLVDAGVSNAAILSSDPELSGVDGTVPYVSDPNHRIDDGDVVAITPGRDFVHVLYRTSDQHHTVFLTNQCNSNCLMCSQPPTRQDDSWLIDEAKTIARHIQNAPPLIGLTGGEPLLLGLRLLEVLGAYADNHPGVAFDILTNGRRLSDTAFAERLLYNLPAPCTWMVPLYGHADFLHDFVVQSPGAFDQTIDGLLTLQHYVQPIQLRIVLIAPTLQILPELCAFIGRNLPFVREVALMGCEPIGFARANQDLCQIDAREWETELRASVRCLHRFDIPTVLMNLPLCGLPRDLWPYAHQSISDWKRTFAPECASCTVQDRCSGLFSWYHDSWRPTSTLTPIMEHLT